MKSFYLKTVLSLLFTISSIISSDAQLNSGLKDTSFDVSYIDPTSSIKYQTTAKNIVINHEEQYSFVDLKKAAKKNKNLTLTLKKAPDNSFIPGSSYSVVVFSKNGKYLKLKDVKVLKNQQKGKAIQIKLSYKSTK